MPSLAPRCLLTIGLMLLAVAVWAHWPIEALPAGTVADRILIEKAARRLTLFRGTTVVQTYAVSLGLAPVGAKEREGDQRTPEGRYRVTEHKEDSSPFIAPCGSLIQRRGMSPVRRSTATPQVLIL